VAAIVAVPIVIVLVARPFGMALRGRRRIGGPLDELVELTAIQPDAAAFRAIVDLHVLALGHHQIDLAGGTQQTDRRAHVTHGFSSGTNDDNSQAAFLFIAGCRRCAASPGDVVIAGGAFNPPSVIGCVGTPCRPGSC
jgi:hypothetical protein